MKRLGSLGRADLADILAKLDEDQREAAAGLLGYVYQPREKAKPVSRFISPEGASLDGASEGEPEFAAGSMAPVPFWRLDKYVARPERPPAKSPPRLRPKWLNRPAGPPKSYCLEDWRTLGPRLLGALGVETDGSEPDVDQAVEILSRGESLEHLARKPRVKPLRKIQVVLDRSSHLMPYWFDQDVIAGALAQHFGGDAIETVCVREIADERNLTEIDEGGELYRLPPPGSAVLALSDLGSLSPHMSREQSWLRFSREIRAGGCAPIALTPSPAGLIPAVLRRSWRLIQWGDRQSENVVLDGEARRLRVQRLLALLSHAFRIEPGLLRAVRLELGFDAGSEAEAWAQLARKHPSAGTLAPGAAEDLRKDLEQEDEALKRKVLELQRQWRHGAPDEVWFDELLNLPAGLRKMLPHSGEDADQARRFFDFLAEAPSPGMRSWVANRVAPRATGNARAAPEFARAEYKVMKDNPDFLLSAAVDPAWLEPSEASGGPVQFRLDQERLLIQQAPVASLGVGGEGGFSPHLGVMASKNGVLNWAVIADPHPDPALFWRKRKAPSWASNWGEDEFGPYADFSVGKAVQRLRWIPRGSFWMGSPEDEEGRFGDEGPRHEVTFGDGFWMMDAPVRQCLWREVMGDNPSEFVGDERPVEQVDWTMAQEFVSRLNERIPGLELALPSEAQWEYACRGGCDAAIYGEDLGQIAWWANNSEMETHPVAQKLPNAYGLYDMLGNVWEWCADHWHGAYEGAPADGSAWIDDDAEAAAHRVIRGGSWRCGARYVRAACRDRYGPSNWDDDLGFRCARVHTSDRQGAAAPGDREAGRLAERRAAARLLGDAAAVRLTPETPTASAPLPQAGRLRIMSDSAELEFARTGRPAWASAMGCDPHGLFAEFKIDEVVQRLRWIPPGRFWMGSPEDEQGRWDAEGSRHEVTLGAGFWIMDTPVRQNLWQAVMGNNPSKFPGPDRPVERVDWNMTQEFLLRLNGRIAGLELALPSEAQWEYACRAGTEAATYAAKLDRIAWYQENSESQTHPVGQKLPNAYGVYDMLGNVWEWCADHWHDSYKGAPTDGSAWQGRGAAADRVLRGGSWNDDAGFVRAAYRDRDDPSFRGGLLGFRCARVQS